MANLQVGPEQEQLLREFYQELTKDARIDPTGLKKEQEAWQWKKAMETALYPDGENTAVGLPRIYQRMKDWIADVVEEDRRCLESKGSPSCTPSKLHRQAVLKVARRVQSVAQQSRDETRQSLRSESLDAAVASGRNDLVKLICKTFKAEDPELMNALRALSSQQQKEKTDLLQQSLFDAVYQLRSTEDTEELRTQATRKYAELFHNVTMALFEDKDPKVVALCMKGFLLNSTLLWKEEQGYDVVCCVLRAFQILHPDVRHDGRLVGEFLSKLIEAWDADACHLVRLFPGLEVLSDLEDSQAGIAAGIAIKAVHAKKWGTSQKRVLLEELGLWTNRDIHTIVVALVEEAHLRTEQSEPREDDACRLESYIYSSNKSTMLLAETSLQDQMALFEEKRSGKKKLQGRAHKKKQIESDIYPLMEKLISMLETLQLENCVPSSSDAPFCFLVGSWNLNQLTFLTERSGSAGVGERLTTLAHTIVSCKVSLLGIQEVCRGRGGEYALKALIERLELMTRQRWSFCMSANASHKEEFAFIYKSDEFECVTQDTFDGFGGIFREKSSQQGFVACNVHLWTNETSQELLRLSKLFEEAAGPILLLGDFNTDSNDSSAMAQAWLDFLHKDQQKTWNEALSRVIPTNLSVAKEKKHFDNVLLHCNEIWSMNEESSWVQPCPESVMVRTLQEVNREASLRQGPTTRNSHPMTRLQQELTLAWSDHCPVVATLSLKRKDCS
eukprot:scaffold957_cov322-Pavlova_lutheri.AAC.11